MAEKKPVNIQQIYYALNQTMVVDIDVQDILDGNFPSTGYIEDFLAGATFTIPKGLPNEGKQSPLRPVIDNYDLVASPISVDFGTIGSDGLVDSGNKTNFERLFNFNRKGLVDGWEVKNKVTFMDNVKTLAEKYDHPHLQFTYRAFPNGYQPNDFNEKEIFVYNLQHLHQNGYRNLDINPFLEHVYGQFIDYLNVTRPIYPVTKEFKGTLIEINPENPTLEDLNIDRDYAILFEGDDGGIRLNVIKYRE